MTSLPRRNTYGQFTVAARPTLMNRKARELLNLFRSHTEIGAEIEEGKSWFRDEANGETISETVAGLGTVQVKKGAEPSSGIATVFSEEAFDALPAYLKNALITKGVVTKKRYTKAGTKPAVVITLNK